MICSEKYTNEDKASGARNSYHVGVTNLATLRTNEDEASGALSSYHVGVTNLATLGLITPSCNIVIN